MPITLSPPLPHAEAAARAGFPSVSAHISQKTCLADWLMMTDGRCAGALRQFWVRVAHPVYCGSTVQYNPSLYPSRASDARIVCLPSSGHKL